MLQVESRRADGVILNRKPHVFIGGYDLEMITLIEMIEPLHNELIVHDEKLSWGAKASSYQEDLKEIISANTPALLVELDIDVVGLESATNVTVADHHGSRVGELPVLKQAWDWLADQELHVPWRRWYDIVCENDIGHIDGLLKFGADHREVDKVRRLDRRAQGITEVDELQSRVDLKSASIKNGILIVESELTKTSAIADFAHPFYGGEPHDGLLITTPTGISFFGVGALIDCVKCLPGCWYGGSLPKQGYWGANLNTLSGKDEVFRLLGLN
jgi:hypothetical protein